MKVFAGLGLALTLCLTWCCGAAEAGSGHYLTRLNAAVDGIAKDLPSITRSAEAAAKRFVEEKQGISVWGDAGFVTEALGRAGGVMAVKAGSSKKDSPICEVMLLAPKEDKLAESVSAAATNRKSGGLVIGFGRADLMEQARKAGVEFDFVIDTHIEKGKVPLDPAAQNTALWVWTGEFVSACTRLGAMPTMYQSIMVPGSRERNAALKGVTVCPGKVEQIPPGRLGGEYIKELRDRLAFLAGVENGKILEAAKRASAARLAGKTAYGYCHGHSVMNTLGRSDNPGMLVGMKADWYKPKDGIVLKSGDFVLMVGYDWLCQGPVWGDFAAKAREAGAGVAWSFTDYKKEDVAAVAPDEIWINQHWALGDAEVAVSGYDVRILPISGVIAEAVLGMVEAEMVLLEGAAGKTAGSAAATEK